MHDQIIPPLDRSLGALAKILTKAEAHAAAKSIAPEALLSFRLFPDMFALTRQVQLACDFAARAAARMAGETPASFPDIETSFAELQTRIAAARACLAGFGPAAYEGAASRAVTIRMRGQDVTMPGLDYFTLYSLPQFYFHLTTAYNILRHNGVELGKPDYMGA